MDASFGRAFDVLVYPALLLMILAPFGVWKLIDILLWIFQHVKLSIQ